MAALPPQTWFTLSALTKNNNEKFGYCHACGNDRKFVFKKLGSDNELYSILECLNCGLWQVSPQPSEQHLHELYAGEYFKKRTDRGYNDYSSEKVAHSVQSTLEKNLTDLNFFEWEKTLEKTRRILDVGCASGHVVEWFHERGWYAEGIDIASEMIAIGVSKSLNLIEGDFLAHPFKNHQYDLITLWASIEHLKKPGDFFKRFYKLLKPGGKVYLSTCHLGLFARFHGENWRFMNVPEHLYFFTRDSLRDWAFRYDLKMTQSFTYGSGFTSKEEGDIFYRASKAAFDEAARHLHMGDMIVVEFTAFE